MTDRMDRMRFSDETILGGRLLVKHTASSGPRPGHSAGYGEGKIFTTTKIEIIALDLRHLHLIKYVLVALAVADLPGKGWTVHHDGGSARLIFTRPAKAIDVGSLQKLRETMRNLAVPNLEPCHANG